MSLSRAFTSRRPKNHYDMTPLPNRAVSHRRQDGTATLRSKISGPVELLSSTNMLSYTAPDLYGSNSPISASDDDSESSSQIFSSRASNTSSTDSVGDSPAPNHLTAFFSNDPSNTITNSTIKNPIASPPVVPHRANSHTTATHKAMARHRSLSRDPPPPPNAIHNLSNHARTSATAPIAPLDAASHPFSRELQQVNELAEEMGLQSSIEDEEEELLRSKGLRKFGVEDYLMEIEQLFGGPFGRQDRPLNLSWI